MWTALWFVFVLYLLVAGSGCAAHQALWPIAWPLYTLDAIIREFVTAIKYCFRKE